MRYWLNLFSGKTWREFLRAGGTVTGFRETQRNQVKKIKPGDKLVCFCAGLSRFVGVLEATSEGYWDEETRIWEDSVFPARVKVKPLISLELEFGVAALPLVFGLETVKSLKNAETYWGVKFQRSPVEWSQHDGELVVSELKKAEQNPILKPFNEKLALRKPQVKGERENRKVKIAAPPPPPPEPASSLTTIESSKTRTETLAIQRSLVNLGLQMGFEVWVDRSDKSHFSDIPGVLAELPIITAGRGQSVIEHIDVLWLKEKTIHAAFEVENSTSIYSGLLRLSDLFALHPNLYIPLFVVVPDRLTERVRLEVQRPTFQLLEPPLAQRCSLITFSSLAAHIQALGQHVKHLKITFLHEIAESCEAA